MPSASIVVVTTNGEGPMVAMDLARNMADRFGGSSVSEGMGFYVAEDGTLIKDYHMIVKSYMVPLRWNNDCVFKWVRDQAAQIRELLGEESVAVIFSPYEHMEFAAKGDANGTPGLQTIRRAAFAELNRFSPA